MSCDQNKEKPPSHWLITRLFLKALKLSVEVFSGGKKDADDRIAQVFLANLFLALGANIWLLSYGLALYWHDPKKWPTGGSFITYAMMLGLASTALGFFLGFLFGIPRSATGEQNTAIPSGQPQPLRTNTNMEQISDWLTKIIVGVGLVEAKKIMTLFANFTERIGPALIPVAHGWKKEPGQVLAGCIIIFFLIEGFLAAYLWTRLYLPVVQKDLDGHAQDDKDKQAIAKANEQLNLPNGAQDISVNELNDAISGAKGSTISIIYIRAQYVLKDAINQKDVDRIKRTIPVFSELARIDVNNHYPENHEQLGYAYFFSDQYDKAIESFTTAITAFDGRPYAALSTMKVYRAECRIMLLQNKKPVSPQDIALIASDIDAAKKDPQGIALLAKDGVEDKMAALQV